MKKLLLALLIFVVLERFCHHETYGFQVAKIQAHHLFDPRWEVPTSQETPPSSLLNQTFKLTGYGGESYMFLSEDGKVVLKLFKQHHLFSHSYLKHLPLPRKWKMIVTKFVRKKETKRPKLFHSACLSYTQLRNRAGLFYLHINPTHHLKKTLTLIDRLNISHEIDLDTASFALQYRALLLQDHFLKLKTENNLASAQESIDSLLSLILTRCEQGIRDHDPSIRRNCGFIGNTAIDIDLGSFSYDETVKLPFIKKTILYQDTLKFKKWLEETYPEASIYLNSRLESLLTD